MCDWHKPDKLDYLSAHADADRRIAAGQRQSKCSICKFWLWHHERGAKPRGCEVRWTKAE